MAQLTLDTPRIYEVEADNELPILASTQIFEGACVGESSGYMRQLVAGDPFRGFAVRGVDNSAGSNGDKSVELNRKGVIKLDISAVAITDEGKSVYASDSNTFTLTATSNTRIGYIIRVESTGVALVAYEEQSGDEVALTDNSGGTASDVIASIGAAYDDTEVSGAIASLAAKVNTILARQNN
jgi:predicted RecA/RadA family phage recombinase